MTTPIAALPAPSPMPAGAALQLQLKAIQSQISHSQAQVTSLKSQLAKTRNAGQKAAIQRQIDNANKLITANTAKQGTVQNSLYRATGQFEKFLTGQSRDAYIALNTLFQSYGLGSLAGKIFDYVKNGYGSDTISLLLQDSPEYKARFAANASRQKAGLPVLSPADYLNTESSYRDIMRQSGLPTGFYDSHSDFQDFIAKDVSPTELKSRVDLATQASALTDPTYKQALQQMGLGTGDVAAYFLDPQKATPFLQKTAATAAVGAEALARGFAFDKQYAENLATQGITRAQASQGYGQIGTEFNQLQTLGNIYGTAWTQRQAENAQFIGGTEATQERARLVAQERAQFSGGTGTARAALAPPNIAK